MEILLKPEEEKLYMDCITLWGPINQLEQYAEECLEAALAVRKLKRARDSGNIEKMDEALTQLRGEIIDTLNMSIQMKKIFLNDIEFNNIWNYKINRQIDRVIKNNQNA